MLNHKSMIATTKTRALALYTLVEWAQMLSFATHFIVCYGGVMFFFSLLFLGYAKLKSTRLYRVLLPCDGKKSIPNTYKSLKMPLR